MLLPVICSPRTASTFDHMPLTRPSSAGFTGSTKTVMESAVARFSAATVKLTTTFRCSVAVVNATNVYFDKYSEYLHDFAFRARDGADAGLVVHNASFITNPIGDAIGDVAVLSRKTAPLVMLYFNFVKRNTPVKFLGRETLGKQMAETFEKIVTDNIKTIDEVVTSLALYHMSFDLMPSSPSSNEEARNRVEALLGLTRVMKELNPNATTEDVRKRIMDFTSSVDDADGVVLSTVHKAKGQEYYTVYILAPEDLPLKSTMETGAQWEKENEVGCGYVALTRAKHTLIMLQTVETVKDLFELPAIDCGEDGAPVIPAPLEAASVSAVPATVRATSAATDLFELPAVDGGEDGAALASKASVIAAPLDAASVRAVPATVCATSAATAKPATRAVFTRTVDGGDDGAALASKAADSAAPVVGASASAVPGTARATSTATTAKPATCAISAGAVPAFPALVSTPVAPIKTAKKMRKLTKPPAPLPPPPPPL